MVLKVAFASQKGGVGKSSLARALAVAAAVDGEMKVRLVDLDPTQRTAAIWNETRRRNKILPGIEVETATGLHNVLSNGQHADLVVLDAPSQVSPLTFEIAQAADFVIQPAGASADDQIPARLVFEAMINMGLPRERLLFAVCRTLSNSEDSLARAALAATGHALLPGVVREHAGYREAQNSGRTLIETTDPALNQQALEVLTPLLQVAIARSVSVR